MAKTLEEMAPYLAQRQRETNAQHKNQLRQRAEVGRVMSELIADPRWELYCRHLDTLRTQEQAKADAISRELTDGQMVPRETYAQQKADLAGARKYVQAMTTAIDLVAGLIKTGDGAIEELTKLNRESR